jgi:hypothetical protein
MAKAGADHKAIVYIVFGSIAVPNPTAMAKNVIKAVLKSDDWYLARKTTRGNFLSRVISPSRFFRALNLVLLPSHTPFISCGFYCKTYSSDDNPDLELRCHNDDLLLDYARMHLMVDHLRYSEDEVYGVRPSLFIPSFVGSAEIYLVMLTLSNNRWFFANLNPIPTHEPGKLVLPGDPWEALKVRWELDSLESYKKAFEPYRNSVEILKKILALPKARSRTDTVWEEDIGEAAFISVCVIAS